MKLIYNIQEGLNWFEQKGIIIFPTETVYGIGTMAHDELSVKEIFRIKNRPITNPLIIHFSSIDQIEQYAYLNDLERAILLNYSPGPITLLLKKKNPNQFSLATNNSEYICARIPQGEFIEKLMIKFGPIAAPSANLSSQLTITHETMIVNAYQSSSIGAYIDDSIVGGLESTIVKIENDQVIILRKGFIDGNQLNHIVNTVYDCDTNKRMIPGRRFLHYQVSKPVIISNIKMKGYFHIGMGNMECDFNLSPTENIQEIKKNYFYSLFLGDKSPYEKISICKFPNEVKFHSILDRLEKTLKIR